MTRICPEAAIRDAMDDATFWEHVLQPDTPPMDYDGPDLDDDPPDDGLPVRADPCPECGEVGACSWDAEGRPLIHALRAEDCT